MDRIGLDHANAGWADPGWTGSVLTLELKNLTQETPIRLRPGDPIGQMVFFSCTSVPEDKSYAVRGRYNGDTSVSGIKP
jgi:deoxycytidine triphosphate deaminase